MSGHSGMWACRCGTEISDRFLVFNGHVAVDAHLPFECHYHPPAVGCGTLDCGSLASCMVVPSDLPVPPEILAAASPYGEFEQSPLDEWDLLPDADANDQRRFGGPP